MHKPPHPGEILKGLYLAPLDLSVTEAAKALGVTRKSLSQLVNKRAGISITMALKRSKAFSTTPEPWLNMQRNYDVWFARKKTKLSKVRVLVENSMA